MKTALALLVGVVSFGCGQVGTGAVTQSSSSPTTLASPAPAATAEQVPPSNPAAFACTEATGSGSKQVNVVKARAGSASGYDRFVLEFDGAVPTYSVMATGSASFIEDGSGRTLQLAGSNGILIRVWNSAASRSFAGATDVTYGYPMLKESRRTGDYEGYVSWGLGLSGPGCFRAFTLTKPDRLVVDVQAA